MADELTIKMVTWRCAKIRKTYANSKLSSTEKMLHKIQFKRQTFLIKFPPKNSQLSMLLIAFQKRSAIRHQPFVHKGKNKQNEKDSGLGSVCMCARSGCVIVSSST